MVDKLLENKDTQQELKEAEPKDKSSSALRDRLINIVRNADLDFAPEYIAALPSETDPRKKAMDGVIRTAIGYFRLAADEENKTRILLFSTDPENLRGAWGEDGRLHLPENPATGKITDDVYVVSAREAQVDGARFRQDMTEFEQNFKRNTLFDLNLAMEDMTPAPTEKEDGSTPDTPLRVYKMTNSKVALGLFETPEKKWRMRLYSNMRGDWDETGSFVEIEESIPDGFIGNRVFTTGQDYKKEFDDFGEALDAAKRYWHLSAMRMWKGRPMLSELEPPKFSVRGARNFAEKQVLSFLDQKKHRAFGITILATLVTSAGAIFGGAVGLIGVGGLIAGALAVKAMEDYWTDWVNDLRKKHDMKQTNGKKPVSERDLSADYTDPSPENDKRLCKKLKQEALPRLRLLSYQDSHINYDNGGTVSPNRQDWEAQVLMTMPHRVFANITVPLDDNTAVTHYPNGILSLTHVDFDTKKSTSFVAYNPELAVSKSAPLQNGLRRLLSDGNICEISYDRKTPLQARSVKLSELKNRLKDVFAHESADKREKLAKSLTEHFSDAAAQAKTKAAAPKPKKAAPRSKPA
ncbi:MAG: hypothetical protein HND56_09810 [Pseudomonadota bacterium]|nr:MAG: hypothetical protein HND56_09810 [Pseudomonadota bacterium]